MTIVRLKPGPRMTQATIHAGTVYLAGQVALDHRGADVAQQTRAVLAQVDALLVEAGTDRSNILSANIWLTNPADFNAFNEIWDAWLAPDAAPARATVCAALVLPGLNVEVAVIAALPA